MPKVTVDTTRALARHHVDALWRLNVSLRGKTLWKMLYSSAARAEEILSLNIEDLDLPNKQARVIGKGGNAEIIHWQSGTAHLLPRLIAGRPWGPLFLADRLPTKPVATLDQCPHTGRARLSYRRAAEIFEQTTRPLANPSTNTAELGAFTRLDAAPATPRRAHPRRRRRHQHTHPARPQPPPLHPLPRALHPRRPRRPRPARRGERPQRAPQPAQLSYQRVTLRLGPRTQALGLLRAGRGNRWLSPRQAIIGYSINPGLWVRIGAVVGEARVGLAEGVRSAPLG